MDEIYFGIKFYFIVRFVALILRYFNITLSKSIILHWSEISLLTKFILIFPTQNNIIAMLFISTAINNFSTLDSNKIFIASDVIYF